jgi:hypothetical protein
LLLLGGCFLQATALVLAGLATNGPILAAVALLAGLGASIVLISYLTVRTAASPDTMLGRIGATARVLSFGLQPLGTVAAGVVIDLSDGSTTLVGMGLLLACVGLIGLRSQGLRIANFRSASSHSTAPVEPEPAA